MEISKNVIENMMMIYIDHKKILNEYEKFILKRFIKETTCD